MRHTDRRLNALVTVGFALCLTALGALGAAVSNPVFSPVPGTYSSSVAVSLACSTAGATICFTLDGTPPTTASPVYKAPIALTRSATIKAQAYATGMTPSSVVSGAYVISNLPRVATPTLTPVPGTYAGSVTVTMACATTGATIYYQLMNSAAGTTPPAAVVYTGPLTFATTTYLRVWATKSGMLESVAVTGGYVITPLPVAPPRFTPPPSTTAFTAPVTVAMASETADAVIRYTVNGTDPTATSTLYTAPVKLTATTTLKAKAFKIGLADSKVTTGQYIINLPRVATPTLTPVPGTYAGRVTVTLACATDGATIYYQLLNNAAGTTPPAAVVYTGPLTFTAATYLKVWATKIDMLDSLAVTAGYTIAVLPPRFTPPPSTTAFTAPVTVAMASETADAVIRYTVNGTDPTATSTLYTAPVKLTATTTLKAKAFKTGLADSKVTTGQYIINLPRVATPTLTPVPGTYAGSVTVTMACATTGATIYYQLLNSAAGTTPPAAVVYTGPLTFTAATYLKVWATKTDMLDSLAVTAGYTIAVLPPRFTPPPSTTAFTAPVTVAMASETADAAIRYTVNGTDPTATSTLYTAPVKLTATTTLKAKAFKTGLADSKVTTGQYIINLPRVATPTLTPVPGTYAGSVTVTLACATTGATIYYQIMNSAAGTTPPAAVVYTGPLTFTAVTYLKVWATKADMLDSLAVTAGYAIATAQVTPPILDPPQGLIVDSLVVRMGCATVGATIRYTLDSSEPSATSPAYTNSLTLTGATVLKARAFKDGLVPSGIVTGVYTK